MHVILKYAQTYTNWCVTVTSLQMEKIGEKTLERYFTRQALLRGLLCKKFISPGQTGTGDRIVCGPLGALPGKGMTWYAELKGTGKKPSDRQLFVHKEYLNYGIVVHVLDTKEDVITFFKMIDNDIQSA